MKSLVSELQTAAETGTTKVSDLLRKAKVVSVKLQRTDINEWLQKETYGYSKNAYTPEYRKLCLEIKAYNPYNGSWLPIKFMNAKFENDLSCLNLKISVAQLEAILDQTIQSDSASIGWEIPQTLFEKKNKDNNIYELGMKPCWRINRLQIPPILDAIRGEVLDWSLELDDHGIKGKGMMFSTEDVGKATTVIFNINKSNVGDIGGLNSSIAKTDNHSSSCDIQIDNNSAVSFDFQIDKYSKIYSEQKNQDMPDNDIIELKAAINLLQEDAAKGKGNALKKVKKFLKEYGPVIAALTTAIKSILK